MRHLLLLIALLITSSCVSSRVASSATASKEISVIRVIDTVKTIKVDTTSLVALMECDSVGKIRLASIHAKDSEISRLVTSIANNRFDVKVITKEIERWRERIVIDTLYQSKEITVVKEVIKPLAVWQKWLIWIGVAYIAKLLYTIYRSWGSLSLKTIFKLF